MAEKPTKPEAGEKPKTPSQGAVDPEGVRVEDMELSEQQLRMVSGGKGLGGAVRAIGGVVGRMGGLRAERPDGLQGQDALRPSQLLGQ